MRWSADAGGCRARGHRRPGDGSEGGGVRLERPLPPAPGSYEIDVENRVTNVSGAAGCAARSTCSSCATAMRARANPACYSTFHRPGRLHRADKFQKSTSATSRRARPKHAAPGPTTAGSRWSSTTSCRPGCPQAEHAARVSTPSKVDTNLYAVGMLDAARHDRAGRDRQRSTRRCIVGPQESSMLEQVAPGPRPGQGLRLADDHRQAAVLAARRSCTACIGNWGWAIIALTS